MCGIAGFLLGAAEWTTERLASVASTMANSLEHRGPDDGGTWVDPAAGVALGHRRLSVVDLSPAGHQPMVSASGRWVLAYNGELYNADELRIPMEDAGVPFRGRSDTEVLINAFDRVGVEAAIKQVNGMFALAAWDRFNHRLWLARDRLGEKPLYYGWAASTFLFASELKALRCHPEFVARVDRATLSHYFARANVPASLSIYEGIRKLPAGSVLSISSVGRDQILQPRRYWSAEAVAHDGVSWQQDISTDELASLLLDAVRRRTVSDVPVGALLSGGIDSTTVVALMQATSGRPVRTFTIGFSQSGFDEAPYARRIAAHLGTDHTELYVTPTHAQSVIPQLPQIYDEPFADSSQIPTFLVCELARRSVTVALSGDGGDEVFGGYARHLRAEKVWRRSRALPAWARRGIAAVGERIPSGRWEPLASAVARTWPRSRLADPRLLERGRKAALVTMAPSLASAYERLISHWDPGRVPVLGGSPWPYDTEPLQALPTLTEYMMLRDLAGYLPDDILVKLDRASMAVSLEVRPPLLDHRVVEAAWRLPLHRKVAGRRGKLALREVLGRYVPTELIDRPKAGFAIPLGDWLRGPLREWAEELLDERRLQNEGFLEPGPVRRVWLEHLARRGGREDRVWTVLMFQAWLENTHARLPTADGP